MKAPTIITLWTRFGGLGISVSSGYLNSVMAATLTQTGVPFGRVSFAKVTKSGHEVGCVFIAVDGARTKIAAYI
jgi:hypothetical protein